MGENKRVIDLKKSKLKEELSKENPNKFKIKRLKNSIKRHKIISKSIVKRRIKNKKYGRR